MKFSMLSPFAFVLGAAALAAILFALQRLRVRFREVEVATTLFWREAIEETRARVFVQRFRHPWAYLLVLLISLLIWFAVAGPIGVSRSGEEHVLLIDASAGMARPLRFEAACAAATQRASELPRGHTRVLVVGAHATTLLERDEPLALLERRLRDVRIDTCPSGIERAILSIRHEAATDGMAIEIFGDGAIESGLSAELGSGFSVTRAALADGSLSINSGIVALGVSESLSGAADRVDVYVETAGDGGAGAPPVRLALDGKPLEGMIDLPPRAKEPSRRRFVARNVPARGGTLEASFDPTGDGLAEDDKAAIVLPNRPPLRVAIVGLADAAALVVQAALAADTGVEVVLEAPDVVIRSDHESKFADRPSLIVSTASVGAAFLVGVPAGEWAGDADSVLRESFDELGLSDVDAVSLATEIHQPIELAVHRDGKTREIAIWSQLLEPAYDFTQSRAFPRFLARAIRFLAREAPLVPEVAAGRTIDATDRAFDRLKVGAGVTLDGAGAALRVPRQGSYTNDRGESLRASLLDIATTRPPELSAKVPAAATTAGVSSAFGPHVFITAAILIALLLLAVEWALVRGERIP